MRRNRKNQPRIKLGQDSEDRPIAVANDWIALGEGLMDHAINVQLEFGFFMK
jgi:hypothetical protein